ncbi:hypothetical protein [Actinomycetospora sp.]|uniref:hypothetical protein n=1 Tax=Actinomycetospora sp. TaxID=1872135 RepID=UPI002F41E14F
MTEPERQILDRTFDSPSPGGPAPGWLRRVGAVVALAVAVAFVLSLLALALLA